MSDAPLTLRDYQTADIEKLRDAFRQGARAPLYQLSTGGGKTIVFATVVKSAVAKGTKVLVLAHRRELIKQASAKLDWIGVPHGIVAAGQDRDHDAQVIVASIQTIARRLDLMPAFGLIVIDEAHHAVASTWSKLLARQPDARLLGVTATPQRLDGKGLGKHCGGHFDAIVCGPSMQELVDAGFLAPCRVFIPSAVIDTTGIRTLAGDYDEGQLESRAQGVTGDAIAEFAKLPPGTTAMAFCVTVKHAQDVAAAFQDAGYAAVAVHGGMDKAERDDAIQGLQNGRTQVLSSCEIISEGVDVPSVGCVILLRPTKSLTMALQQIGRGMRPKADGGHLTVLDHARNCIEHGLPCEPRDWTLDGQKDKGDPKKTKPAPWGCIRCDVLNPANRTHCIECGTAKPWLCKGCGQRNADEDRRCLQCSELRPTRPILEMDNAPMRELQASEYAHILRMSYGQLLRKRRSEAELAAYARARGYRPGWVYWKLKEQAEQFGSEQPNAP